MYKLLPILLLVGCGSGVHIDSQLQPLVNDYLEHCGGNLDSLISIKLSPLKSEVAGVCTTYGQDRTVTINSNLLSMFQGDDYRTMVKAVLYHELSHCLIGADHVEGGLMSVYAHSPQEYRNNWQAWITELGCK